MSESSDVCEGQSDGVSSAWYVSSTCDGICWNQACTSIPIWDLSALLIDRSRGIIWVPFTVILGSFLVLFWLSFFFKPLRQLARAPSPLSTLVTWRSDGVVAMLCNGLLQFGADTSNCGLAALACMSITAVFTPVASSIWHSSHEYAIDSNLYSFVVASGVIAVQALALAVLSCAPLHRLMNLSIGLSFVRTHQWSRFLAHVAVFSMIVHGIAASAYSSASPTDTSDTLTGYGAIYGTLATVCCMLAAWASPVLQSRNYEVYAWSQGLMLVTVGFSVLHSSEALIEVPVLVLLLLVLVYRRVFGSQGSCTLVGAQTIGDAAIDAQAKPIELQL